MINEWIKNGKNKEKGDQVISLDISGKNLKEFPKDICYLVNLKYLNLHSNNIKFLPEEFGNLVHLIDLNVSDNEFQKIPNSFKNLVNLKILNLSSNFIDGEIPEYFNNFVNLEKLDLYENRIHSFSNLAGCVNLSWIYYFHNPVDYETIPPNVRLIIEK